MDILLRKAILLLVMFAVTMGLGVLPIWVLKLLRRSAVSSTIKERRWPSMLLSWLTCFSGGVFFGSCFLHLLPEVKEKFAHVAWTQSYPCAELISCLGFFLIFLVEECVLMCFPWMGHGGGHSHAPPADTVHVRADLEPTVGFKPSGSPPPLDSSSHATHLLADQSATSTSPMLLVEPQPPCDVDKVCDEEVQRAVENGQFSQSQGSSAVRCVDPRCHTATYFAQGDRRMLTGTGLSGANTPELMTATSVHLAEPERCELDACEENEVPPILMFSQPHAHSHGTRSVTFVLALSFHSIIEGVALGVANDTNRLVSLFVSVMIHKAIVAFSVGMQLSRTHAHQQYWVAIAVLVLALMTPIGALMGMFLQDSSFVAEGATKDTIVMCAEGIAVGTFLYVTFFEVLIHERDNEHKNLPKLAFIFLGFSVIALLRYVDKHEHSHGSTTCVSEDVVKHYLDDLSSLHDHDGINRLRDSTDVLTDVATAHSLDHDHGHDGHEH